jgi:hypothetical protein
MKHNRQFLDIAEYASLAGSALGTVVAIASGQVAYAAAPLTLAISINLLNRRSSIAKLYKKIKSLHLTVQQLPAQQLNINTITQSLQQINQNTELLTQRFDARLEPEQIEELNETIAHLSHLQNVDLSAIAQSIEELNQSYQRLTQEFNARPETQEVVNLTNELNILKVRLDNFPILVDLSEIQAELATLKAPQQAIDQSSINESIIQLQSQIAHIYQQIQEFPPPFDPSLLEERMQKQEESAHTITAKYNRLIQVVKAEIVKLRQSVTSIQNSAITSVAEVRQHLAKEIELLRATIDTLSSLNKLDLSKIEAEIEILKLQIQAIDSSSITSNIVQLESDIQTQINQINNEIKQLHPLFDLDAIKQQLSELDEKNRNLFNDYVERLVPAVKALRSDKTSTQQAIVDILNQLNALELKLNNLLIPPEPIDLSEIEAVITNLENQLGNLTQQFNARPEPTAIKRLDEKITVAIQRLDNLPPLPEPIDLSEIKELKTEVEQLEERFQVFSRLQQEIELLPQALGQINDIQKHLQDLDVSAGNLHDYARQLKNEVEQRIEQIHLGMVELDERIQKFVQMPEQLQEIKLLTAGLNERTEYLLNHTYNLDEMQQNLINLQQLMNGYAKTTDLENVLLSLSKEFSQQIDIVVNNRVAEINQLLKEITPAYQYELVIDRSGSRNILMKALEETQRRLIIVTPWLSKYSINQEILCKCRTILNRQGEIYIGWGHLSDIGMKYHPTPMTRQQFLQSVAQNYKNCDWKYDALPDLQKLEQEYFGQFQLRLLGTHEKFLVCDDSFAMLGSHNFLTSGTSSSERELGLLTNDPRIIADLISRFKDAKNLETA